MSNPNDEKLSKKAIARRRDETIKRMLATPPLKHADEKHPRKKPPKKKAKPKTSDA